MEITCEIQSCMVWPCWDDSLLKIAIVHGLPVPGFPSPCEALGDVSQAVMLANVNFHQSFWAYSQSKQGPLAVCSQDVNCGQRWLMTHSRCWDVRKDNLNLLGILSFCLFFFTGTILHFCLFLNNTIYFRGSLPSVSRCFEFFELYHFYFLIWISHFQCLRNISDLLLPYPLWCKIGPAPLISALSPLPKGCCDLYKSLLRISYAMG